MAERTIAPALKADDPQGSEGSNPSRSADSSRGSSTTIDGTGHQLRTVTGVTTLSAIEAVLADATPRVIACSGGVDSLTLATVAWRQRPDDTVIAHAVTPAVPAAATARVHAAADRGRWRFESVSSNEFDDPRYLENPTDRCFYCKSHLYDALQLLTDELHLGDAVLMSGANVDDLGEYRPGLQAAAERGVRHPFVEAGVDKQGIRNVARELGLDVADLPASPCLASRLYTGTRVTVDRLRAIELGEELVKSLTGLGIVRCRVRDDEVIVEVEEHARPQMGDDTLSAVLDLMRSAEPGLTAIGLDDRPYRPGRAFISVTAS